MKNSQWKDSQIQLMELYVRNRPAGAGERSERCQILLSLSLRILLDFRV